jgi:hypothetical protein
MLVEKKELSEDPLRSMDYVCYDEIGDEISQMGLIRTSIGVFEDI